MYFERKYTGQCDDHVTGVYTIHMRYIGVLPRPRYEFEISLLTNNMFELKKLDCMYFRFQANTNILDSAQIMHVYIF